MSDTLANFILDLAQRSSSEGLNSRTLRLRIGREDLARHLELTPAALEAEFERLVARRTISLTSGDTVIILDEAALASGRTELPERHREDPSTPEGVLQAILAHERFRAAPRISMLLAYLLEKTLTGEMGQLDNARVGVEALGKPPGFDPRSDPSVRVLVARLQRMLDEYYAEGHEHEFVIRIVPGTFRLAIQSRPIGKPRTDATPPSG